MTQRRHPHLDIAIREAFRLRELNLMSKLWYNYTSSNHIKSSGSASTPRYPFSTDVRGIDTMSDHTLQQSALKVCSKCGESKPLADFYLSKNGYYSSACRDCSNAASRAYHHAHREERIKKISEYQLGNKEKLAATERERRADPAYREKCSVELKEWRERNQEHVAAYNRSQQVKARSAVNKAVLRGALPPANTMVCEGCDEALAMQYHHTDGYEREHWFDITPLCTECHGREHRVNQ